jgi:hypothetical protein
MDAIRMRAAIIAFLEGALAFAEDLDDGPTTYLIERALDEARSQQFSGVPPVHELH